MHNAPYHCEVKHAGLSQSEAADLLKKHGYNELATDGPKSLWGVAGEVIREPMFLLLLSCGGVYMALGDFREGVILLSTIIILIGITFFQHRKTERALESLRQLSSPRALVIRDGLEMHIAGRELVPGDLMIIQEGDRVAGDGTILETDHLAVDESLITGESLPVNKNTSGDSSIVYAGSLVTSGRAYVRVGTTGTSSVLGKISASLKEVEETQTRLQKEMKSLIRRLGFIGILICICVVLVFFFVRGNFIASLLTGLSAAMAILPEEFPVVLSVFLALGAWRLSGKNVLTRKPAAIETLGSATVLCSDKTGTITLNKMQVTAWFAAGEIHQAVSKDSLTPQSADLLKAAELASAPESSDPMEKAIREICRSKHITGNESERLLKEFPLQKDFMAMTRVFRSASGELQAYMKGAPETVLKGCRLSENERRDLLQVMHEMASGGSRLLAVAVDEFCAAIPDSQGAFHLRFLGFIALEDPIRSEVPEAIRECREAGIRVIMITGDNPVTASSIARSCGLPDADIATGQDLAQWSDEELESHIGRIGIFARVIPEQKLRIVRALQRKGEVVAMTGDGVNDAPALKAADIGISMGNKGTDVAREASSLVLLDDNFASIVGGIRLGRRIFDNLQKAMYYIIAVHIPIIGLTMLPAFFPELPLILWPVHIVFLELIIDPVCSIVFESEQEERGVMQRPPRKPEAVFFGKKDILRGAMTGSLMLAAVIFIYLASLHEGHNENEVRAITFSALILCNIFLVITSLSKTRSFLSFLFERQKAAFIVVSVAVVFLIAIVAIPQLRSLFGFDYPGFSHFGTSLGAASLMLAVLESIKYFRWRIARKQSSLV